MVGVLNQGAFFELGYATFFINIIRSTEGKCSIEKYFKLKHEYTIFNKWFMKACVDMDSPGIFGF